MSLNPKLFTGVPPAAPSPDPRLGLPPPPPPRFKFNPAMIQVPPQPTLTDVMIALDTLNKNIANLSKQIDDAFKAQGQTQWQLAAQTYKSAVQDYLWPIWDNTNRLVTWAGHGGGCKMP